MSPHVCPWWGGYFIDNPVRRLVHSPMAIIGPHIGEGMSSLDFGCGMGLFSIAMARFVGPTGRVVAADLQSQMLSVLRNRAARAGVGDTITTHLCEPDSVGLTGEFDFVLAFYSIHEVPQPASTFVELHRLTRPGGRFLWAEPVGHVRKRRFREMLEQAEEAGFAIVERPRIRFSHAVLLERK